MQIKNTAEITGYFFIILIVFFIASDLTLCFASEEEYSESFFSFGGFAEYENYFSLEQGDDFKSSNKKNELRLKLLMKLGGESLFIYAVPDIYLSSSLLGDDLCEDHSYEGNLEGDSFFRVSTKDSELIFNELYLHYSMDKLQIRLGNQIINWGTADVFNPSSYFNPFDMRETFVKNTDSIKFGVPALSAIIYFEDYSAEIVWMPVHVTSDRAKKGEFWAVSPENYTLPIVFLEDEKLDFSSENFGYGLRVTTSFGSMDMALSCYHGPDNEPVYVPKRTDFQNDSPLVLLIAPEYYIVNKIGVDFAKQYKKMVFQFEAAYSPDRRAVIEQDLHIADLIKLPYELRKTDCLSYTAGFNYFIPIADFIKSHEGEMIFTFEWFSSIYFNNKVMEPVLSDYFSMRLEDTFFDGHFYLRCTSILDTRYNGSLIWPEMLYDFGNGFSLEIAYAIFDAKKQDRNKEASLFYYIEDNDILSLKVKYEF